LEALGVNTIGQLAARPRDEVLARFGASGAWIHELAHGIDARRVNPRREEKSYSVERTFEHDVQDREKLLLQLFQFCEELGERLRDRGLRGRTIGVKVRYASFKTVTRSFTLDFATNLGPRIYSAARGLFARTPPGSLRLLGVQVSGLEECAAADRDLAIKRIGGRQTQARIVIESERVLPFQLYEPGLEIVRIGGKQRVRKEAAALFLGTTGLAPGFACGARRPAEGVPRPRACRGQHDTAADQFQDSASRHHGSLRIAL
jgi:hypothetical protein